MPPRKRPASSRGAAAKATEATMANAMDAAEASDEDVVATRKRGGRRKKIADEETAVEKKDDDDDDDDAEKKATNDARVNGAEAKTEAGAKPVEKKRKLSKKADAAEAETPAEEPAEEKKGKKPTVGRARGKEIEKPVIKVPSSTSKLLELKAELEDGLRAYEETQGERASAREELERARTAMEAAQAKVDHSNSHANRVVRRLKQTARHIQEQSVNAVMLQETLITKTVKKASKVQDPSLVDFAKTCVAVTTEWIDLIRTSAVNLLTIKPVEEVKKVVVAKEEVAPEADVKMEDVEEKPIPEAAAKSKLPSILAETFAKTAPASKPVVKVASAGGVPKEPAHNATRLRVARYLEQEHGLSRSAALNLEAALFDQTAETGIAYKGALKRVVEQPNLLSSNASALDAGNVRPALLLAFRG